MNDTPVAVADPATQVETLRQEAQRWRRRFVGAAAALALLSVVSFVQFSGTFMTCRLLHEARLDEARARKAMEGTLASVRAAQDDVKDMAGFVRSASTQLSMAQAETAQRVLATELDKLLARGKGGAAGEELKRVLEADVENERLRLRQEDLALAMKRLEEEIHDLRNHAATLGKKDCPPQAAPKADVPIRPR